MGDLLFGKCFYFFIIYFLLNDEKPPLCCLAFLVARCFQANLRTTAVTACRMNALCVFWRFGPSNDRARDFVSFEKSNTADEQIKTLSESCNWDQERFSASHSSSRSMDAHLRVRAHTPEHPKHALTHFSQISLRIFNLLTNISYSLLFFIFTCDSFSAFCAAAHYCVKK